MRFPGGAYRQKEPCGCGHLRSWHRTSTVGSNNSGWGRCGLCPCPRFQEALALLLAGLLASGAEGYLADARWKYECVALAPSATTAGLQADCYQILDLTPQGESD